MSEQLWLNMLHPFIIAMRSSPWQKCLMKSDEMKWDRKNMRWLTSRTLSVPWSCFIAACRSVSLTWGNSSTPLWIRKHLNPATPAWTIGLSSSWDWWIEMDWQAGRLTIYCYTATVHILMHRWRHGWSLYEWINAVDIWMQPMYFGENHLINWFVQKLIHQVKNCMISAGISCFE